MPVSIMTPSADRREQLNYANDWLLVFLDETGNETFAGTQPYFGIGGCAVLGAHYE